MLFSKCLRAKIYCNMNVHFDPQGCQTLLLKESELFFFIFGLLDYIVLLPCFGLFSKCPPKFFGRGLFVASGGGGGGGYCVFFFINIRAQLFKSSLA